MVANGVSIAERSCLHQPEDLSRLCVCSSVAESPRSGGKGEMSTCHYCPDCHNMMYPNKFTTTPWCVGCNGHIGYSVKSHLHRFS